MGIAPTIVIFVNKTRPCHAHIFECKRLSYSHTFLLHYFFCKRRASKTPDIFMDALIKPVVKEKNIPKTLRAEHRNFRHPKFTRKFGYIVFRRLNSDFRILNPPRYFYSFLFFRYVKEHKRTCLLGCDTFFFTVQCEDMFPMLFYEHEQSHRFFPFFFGFTGLARFFRRFTPLSL